MKALGLAILMAGACAAVVAGADPASNAVSALPMDRLIFDVQRYGNTPAKKAAKEAAREELFRRGTNSLHALMAQVHLENAGIQMFAEELATKLPPADAAGVLVPFLDAPEARTRKLAAYYLGWHMTPEYADRLLPLLRDDEVCGSAIRTLGKWKVKGAVSNIVEFLSDKKEPRRILAINALKEIGDPAVAGVLVKALEDPYFTVRESAQAAIIALGPAAERTVLDELPGAPDRKRRHLIRILGHYHSWRSTRALKGCLRSESADVRAEAEAALRGSP